MAFFRAANHQPPSDDRAALLRRRVFCLLAALLFCYVFLLNLLTPYIADDYTFAFAFDTGDRLRTFPQLLSSLVFHYKEWAGRVIVKFFAQGFTMFPKAVFDVCNAGAYLALGLVLYRLAMGRRTGRYDLAVFVLIEAALWEISPAWGQTNLWMCGACNYLWATLGCCAYLLLWRYYLQKSFDGGKKMLPLMLVGGVLAGWLSENTSAGLLVCLALCILYLLWRKMRVPAWMWGGFAGTLLGFAALILAPGNYNRADDFTDTLPLLTKYANRFFACSNMLTDYALPFLFAFAVLFTLLCFQKPHADALAWPVILLLGGLGANYAMLLSPFYYERSTHGVFALLTAACAACLVQLDSSSLRRGVACAAAAVSILCVFHACDAAYDVACYSLMSRKREAEIVAASATQEQPYVLVYETYAIEPYTRWCGAYGLPDVREEDESIDADRIGLYRAKWYGLNRLFARETRTYLFAGHTNAAFEAGLSEQQP